MKLIVLIGTDCHLELLPHFLEHYSRIGVDLILCGLHRLSFPASKFELEKGLFQAR